MEQRRLRVVRTCALTALLALAACRDAASPASRGAEPAAGPGQPRDLVRTVDVRVEVGSVDRAERRLRAVVAREGGFIQQGTVVRGDNPFASLQLRVPAGRLAALRASLERLGEVESWSEQVEDVTSARVDLDARLRNARAREERLRGLLAGATGDLGQVLEVDKELSRVREEIERMQGERTALGERIETVLANVQLQPRSVAFFEEPGRAIREAAVDGGRAAWGLVVGLVVLAARVGPSLLVLGALGAAALLTLRRILGARRRRADARSPA